MIIWRFKPEGTTNFGDALNDWLWPKLLPPKFTQIPGVFYGIGTVLGAKQPAAERHVVFGAGAGYSALPKPDDTWKVFFVRGPSTAAALGGVQWITDPGILIRNFYDLPLLPGDSVSFMPRWDSMSPELLDGCTRAGIEVIDPCSPVPTVISQISNTGLLLTEALHGAVAADALRIPWISIYANRGHGFKWRDWCASLDMIWNPIDMGEFSLSWARDYAVPQLSARSVSDARYEAVKDSLADLVRWIEDYPL